MNSSWCLDDFPNIVNNPLIHISDLSVSSLLRSSNLFMDQNAFYSGAPSIVRLGFLPLQANNTHVILNIMDYMISFYNEAVQAEFDSWPVGLRARFRALTIRMVTYGPNLGMPHTRAMGDGLFEIRAKADVGIGRGFYCTLVGRRIVILHGFIKKTDKTPQRELDVARDRLKEVLQHG